MLKLLLMALLGIVAFFVILTCLTYTLFCASAGRSPYGLYLKERSQGKTLLWILQGVLSGILSSAMVLLSSPLQFYRRLWHPVPNHLCPLPPVLLVHGVYHNPSAWILYRAWLKRAGFSNVYAFGYSSFGKTFEDILEELDAMVEEISNAFTGRPVILIGHSLGGLLSRFCAIRHENTGRIAAVVTLGTPHRGSRLAAFGFGKLARSLGYRGDLIRRIEGEAQPSQIPCLAVFSPIDNMVLPSDSLRIAVQGWTCYESAPLSHVALLYHSATARYVTRFLLDVCGAGQAYQSSQIVAEYLQKLEK